MQHCKSMIQVLHDTLTSRKAQTGKHCTDVEELAPGSMVDPLWGRGSYQNDGILSVIGVVGLHRQWAGSASVSPKCRTKSSFSLAVRTLLQEWICCGLSLPINLSRSSNLLEKLPAMKLFAKDDKHLDGRNSNDTRIDDGYAGRDYEASPINWTAEERKKLERKFLWKLDARMSILIVIYILNYSA